MQLIRVYDLCRRDDRNLPRVRAVQGQIGATKTHFTTVEIQGYVLLMDEQKPPKCHDTVLCDDRERELGGKADHGDVRGTFDVDCVEGAFKIQLQSSSVGCCTHDRSKD